QGAGGDFTAQSADVALRADLGTGADRAGDRAARRDQRASRLQHAQRRAYRICARDPGAQTLPGADRGGPARHVGVRRYRASGAVQRDRCSASTMTLEFIIVSKQYGYLTQVRTIIQERPWKS